MGSLVGVAGPQSHWFPGPALFKGFWLLVGNTGLQDGWL